MRTINKDTWDNGLSHFRKIHIWKDYYFVSLFSKTGDSGNTKWNIRNIALYPLSFIFIVVKVAD